MVSPVWHWPLIVTAVMLIWIGCPRLASAEQVRIIDGRGLQRLVAELRGQSVIRISASERESRSLLSCAAVSPDGITVPGEVRPSSECLFVNLPSGTWQVRTEPGDYQWRAVVGGETIDAQRR